MCETALSVVMSEVAKLGLAITHGSIPTNGSFACYVGAGSESERFYNDDSIIDVLVSINGKHTNVQTLLQNFDLISNSLIKYRDDNIIGIRISSVPTFVDKEENSQAWIYNMILNIQVFKRSV